MGKPPVPDRGQSDFLDCNAREPLTGGLSLSCLLHQLRQQDASLGSSSVRSGRDGKCSNKQVKGWKSHPSPLRHRKQPSCSREPAIPAPREDWYKCSRKPGQGRGGKSDFVARKP